MTKLTNHDAAAIKVALKKGYNQSKIAKAFNISRNAINDISTGRTHKNAPIGNKGLLF